MPPTTLGVSRMPKRVVPGIDPLRAEGEEDVLADRAPGRSSMGARISRVVPGPGRGSRGRAARRCEVGDGRLGRGDDEARSGSRCSPSGVGTQMRIGVAVGQARRRRSWRHERPDATSGASVADGHVLDVGAARARWPRPWRPRRPGRHVEAGLGEGDGEGQADVAEPDDADRSRAHGAAWSAVDRLLSRLADSSTRRSAARPTERRGGGPRAWAPWHPCRHARTRPRRRRAPQLHQGRAGHRRPRRGRRRAAARPHRAALRPRHVGRLLRGAGAARSRTSTWASARGSHAAPDRGPARGPRGRPSWTGHRTASSSTATSTRRWPPRSSAPSCSSRSRTSRPACAPSTRRCPRRSTAASRTCSPTCSS